ncbi:hypothetical protein [Clostridium sp.]|uniref:hypothetical protein n=1 Tax=Clostridium sp. TaxID=1506 RepID=UPI002852D2BE|nr:hypothetical protein [Clostridium sp.]
MILKDKKLELSDQIVIIEKILNQRKMQQKNIGNVLFRHNYPIEKSEISMLDFYKSSDGTFSKVSITFNYDILTR